MNDRELLEMAARAAGIESLGYGQNGIVVDISAPCFVGYWNPLSDDGDALRLAALLNLEVGWDDKYEKECNVLVSIVGGIIYDCSFPYNGDKLAATRRAIVSAAAEIGRTMTTESVR